MQRHHAVVDRLRMSDLINFDVTNMTSDTRPSRFSTCNIEKQGRAWGQGNWGAWMSGSTHPIDPKKWKCDIMGFLVTIRHVVIVNT